MDGDNDSGDDVSDEPAWVGLEKVKKSDWNEDDGMMQEVNSRDRVMHIEMTDLWFLKRKMGWLSSIDDDNMRKSQCWTEINLYSLVG